MALPTALTLEQLRQGHPKLETSLRYTVKVHLKNKKVCKVCLQRTGRPTLMITGRHSPDHQWQYKPPQKLVLLAKKDHLATNVQTPRQLPTGSDGGKGHQAPG